jgi:hypothetical protein
MKNAKEDFTRRENKAEEELKNYKEEAKAEKMKSNILIIVIIALLSFYIIFIKTK